ncbi:hypothetical protein [Nostoc sp. ChiVER01]|uniref:hypothetical protein n=1 Tax=Nostoc sp. ChiVER01 TaxID=3075382 RepID=UPI002AD57BC9|nr:hypothetical protein [Nostoc sp. ChiVER01]MDZ8221755.1 hypothetical protein [Nostoc sp. ChiVER01]
MKIGVAERWDELRQALEAGDAEEAGGEFWKLLNHPATMQRLKIFIALYGLLIRSVYWF